MSPELKRCPFCGGKGKTRQTPGSAQLGTWFVMCEKCLTSGNNYATEELAAEKWNRRMNDARA